MSSPSRPGTSEIISTSDSCGGTTGTIGNFVWQDSNGDGDQDAGEAGLANVTVNLYQSDGATLVATTTTDAAGAYSVHRRACRQLRGGGDRYQQCAGRFQPDRRGQRRQSVGGAVRRLCATTGSASPLGGGGTIGWADFGYRPGSGPGSIGNLVWRDLNGDGDRDAGEPGIEGAVVRLYSGATLVSTVVTGPDGSYQFNNLPLGTYQVDVDLSGVLAGFTKTNGAAGATTTARRTLTRSR